MPDLFWKKKKVENCKIPYFIADHRHVLDLRRLILFDSMLSYSGAMRIDRHQDKRQNEIKVLPPSKHGDARLSPGLKAGVRYHFSHITIYRRLLIWQNEEIWILCFKKKNCLVDAKVYYDYRILCHNCNF